MKSKAKPALAKPASKRSTPLEKLQGWFYAAVTHPGGGLEGLRDDAVRARMPAGATLPEDLLLPSKELTGRERLDVYASGYFLRLVDCLAVDYPVVKHALEHAGSESAEHERSDEQGHSHVDDEAFARVARAYLVRHPSTSWTLNKLGGKFPAFLADEAEELEHREFLAELAALEWSMQLVFDERRAEPVDVERLRSIPPERWAAARFRFVPAVRMHSFGHPVNAYLQAVLDEKSPGIPRPEPSAVLVYRKDFRVWRARLLPEQLALLAALRDGAPLADAIERACELPGAEPAALASRLQGWFQEWTGEGIFAAIEFAKSG